MLSTTTLQDEFPIFATACLDRFAALKSIQCPSFPPIYSDSNTAIRNTNHMLPGFVPSNTNALQADKLQALIKAANVEVEPIWTSIFAKVRPFR